MPSPEWLPEVGPSRCAGWPGLLPRISLVPGLLIPPSAVRTLIYRRCEPDIACAIEERGLAPAMRNVTMRALIGHDALANVRAIRDPDHTHRRRLGCPDPAVQLARPPIMANRSEPTKILSSWCGSVGHKHTTGSAPEPL
jgi:hypothetical protein